MRLIVVVLALCMLSCGTFNHGDFTKRKYLNLSKDSESKERCEGQTNFSVIDQVLNNSIISFENPLSVGLIDNDALPVPEFVVEDVEGPNELLGNLNSTEVVETKKDTRILHDINSATEQMEKNDPDPENFHKRAAYSFWLLLVGLIATVVSVPVLLDGPGWLYAILFFVAATGLIVGWILGIKNVFSANEIPTADKYGWYYVKLGFAWFVTVVGFIIVSLLAFLFIAMLF